MTSTAPATTPTLAMASDEDLQEAIGDAHLPSLLVTLAYLTGDLSLLSDEFAPHAVSLYAGVGAQGGMSLEAQEKARERILSTVIAFRDNGSQEAAHPSIDDLQKIMEFMTGPVDEDYIPLLIHELGIPVDLGAPSWTKPNIAPRTDFSVVIVGAGMSGLAAAHRLAQAEIPFTVIERNPEVGGVWWENSYPGARLDTSNFNYSYSFAQNDAWTSQYTLRGEVLGYLQTVADRFDLRRHVRFETQVTAGVFDERTGTWKVTIVNADGVQKVLRCNALISAVGQLNEPSIPDLPGIESFQGFSWHTARWNHDVDLTDKRVGVVGTGASAFQVIPQIAEAAKHVTVFQRTPPWIIPTEGYTSKIPDGLQWLFRNIPHYHRWYRFNQFWMNVDGIRDLALVDPEWKHPVSVSAKNEATRQRLARYLEESFADRPDLIAQVVPDYPPYAKRSLRDDGTWTNALKRADVTLTSSRIAEVTKTGIQTADGVLHECDVIIYGTGFEASDFLRTMELQGRGGVNLHDQWAGDARAFWGVSVPNFPNLFCLYGPNTNLNVNGSVVLFSEAAVEYTLECIKTLLSTGHRAMDVRWDAFTAYNEHVDAASKTLAIGVSTVNSWYKNAFGRVSQNWPLTTIEYWRGTRGPRQEDYELL